MADSARIEDLRKRYHENPRRFFAPLANEYRKSGFLDRSILLCEKHLAEQPDNMNGLVVYGQTLFEAGRQDDAREPFERALKLDPENLIALRQLGDIARLAGDVPTAKGWYDKVLEFDRRNDEVLELLEQMGVGESKETPAATRQSSTMPFISVAPTVSVSGGDAMDIGLVNLDAPKAPVVGPGKTKVINAQRLAENDRRESEAVNAETIHIEPATPRTTPRMPTPPVAKAPKHRASLLDVSFDFSDIPELPSAKPVVPTAPLMGAEAAEYGFADIAPEVRSPASPEPTPIAALYQAPAAPVVPTSSEVNGIAGLELAEFNSEVSPLDGLEATEFTSEDVAPLADLDLPDIDVEDVAPLAGLDRPDVHVEDVAPLSGLSLGEFAAEEVSPLAGLDSPELLQDDMETVSGLESITMEAEPSAQMTAGLPLLGDTPAEPPMAIPPLAIGDVPSLADTLPINTPMMSPWRDTPSQEPPLEPNTAPGGSPRPRMTRADLASLPLLADYGLDDDEPAKAPAAAAPKAPSFVTETMATLYLQQGFRDKAIDVYRQLVAQAPEDDALRAKLTALESAEQEMPDFEAPSSDAFDPDPAPANSALADVSFSSVGLATPRPSSSQTPLATPAVATGPTAREFFSAFARRGLAAAATVAAVSAATAEPAPSESAEVASSEVAAIAAPIDEAPTGWPLDVLFGAPSEVRDLYSAEVLAGIATFVGPTGGSGLDELFAEPAAANTPRRTVARASQMLKFDQFFTPQAGAEANEASVPSAPPAPAAPTAPGDDDLDQFQGWLQALKP